MLARHFAGGHARETRGALPFKPDVLLVLLLAVAAPARTCAQSLLGNTDQTLIGRSPLESARVDPYLSTLLANRAAGRGSAAREVPDLAPEGWVSVMIRGAVSDRVLSAAGARVLTRAGLVTTAMIPVDAVPELLKHSEVQAIEGPHPLEKYLNVSCPDVQAADMWAGSPPNYSGFTGKNVVIGIIDTGLDLTHDDFRTSTNHTRVKYIWDQMGVGLHPPGYNYGVEFTAAQIDVNLTVSTDLDGHGTHIAGIAASNGRATGNSCPAYRYVGMAPEADLIIVRSVLTDLSIIDGANYIFQKAAVLGEPAVILIAAGNQRGGHDGTSSLDAALSALTGPGKLLVAAVGNDGLKAIHSSLSVASGGSGSLHFSIPPYSPSGGETLEMEAWHGGTGQFQVRLTSPTGIPSAWVQPGGGTGTITAGDGTYSISNDVTTNSEGAKEIQVYIWSVGGSNPMPKSGTWTLDVQRVSGASSLRLDAWIASWKFGSGGVTPAFTTNIDYSMQVASPATADSAIAVSAYTTRNTWPNSQGQTSFYTDSPPLQEIYDPSNQGPRRDGVQRPDLSAPGEGVISALSSPVSQSYNTVKVDDGCHWINRGTSVAAAHVAGALALLLEETPTLTPSSARAAIRSRVRTDSHTGSVPNAQWGFGKLDLAASPTGVGSTPGGRFLMAGAYPNPTRGSASFAFNLSSADVGSAGSVTLRILDVRGREVARVNGSVEPGDQRLTWNGLDRHGYAVPAGVYVAQLEVGSLSAQRKLVKIP